VTCYLNAVAAVRLSLFQRAMASTGEHPAAHLIKQHFTADGPFQLMNELHPFYVYRHRQTSLPMVAVSCGAKRSDGTVDRYGLTLYYRAPDNSMNMEIELPHVTMHSMVNFISDQIASSELKDVKDMSKRFWDNLTQHLGTCKNFIGRTEPDSSPVEERKRKANKLETTTTTTCDSETESGPEPEPEVQPEVQPNVESDDDEECMICYENKPTTMVAPCMCCVVCDKCSKGLTNTPYRKKCIRCQRLITGVYYPDNSVVTIK